MKFTLLRYAPVFCSVLSLFALANPAVAVMFDDGGVHSLDTSTQYLWVYDSDEGSVTTVDVAPGGEVQNGARIYDSGRLNVLRGGYVNWLNTFDESVAGITGGYVMEILVGGNSVVNLGGGTVGSLDVASNRATLNIFGTDLAFLDGRVTGTLWDGTPLDAELLSTTYRIKFNPAPESWQNPVSPLDVDHDAVVAPIDSLLIVNEMNAGGSRPLPEVPSHTPSAFFDVNGDGYITPLDSLLIINELNARSGASGAAPPLNIRSVPEPAAWALLVIGAAILLFATRRPRMRFAFCRAGYEL